MAVSGNKGKFSERLKKIAFFRGKRYINKSEKVYEDNRKIYTNYLKVMAAIPGIVYDNTISVEKTNQVNSVTEKNKLDIVNGKKDDIFNDDIHNIQKNINNDNDKNVRYKKEINRQFINRNNKRNREENKRVINSIDVAKIRDKQFNYYNGKGINNDKKIEAIDKYKIEHVNINNFKNEDKVEELNKKISTYDLEKENKVKRLEKSIINLIKKDLIKIVNEMEILQSELYILSEVNGDSRVLKDCQKELEEIKNIIYKIDKLKEQYDFLKDNNDFEYLLEINDNNLVDKIIELKDMFDNNLVKAVAKDYKLLDVYKYLYLKLDDLEEKTNLFQDEKKKEEEKLKERDIDFERLKMDVYNVEATNKEYQKFIHNQNEILKNISDNVNKISSFTQVDYHMKGFNELFRNTFKYFGLLMINPLKGIIPSIATETLITGNLIKNLYKNLEWKETKRTVYEAMDYTSIINNAINDLDSTSMIVDTTLDNIVHLKMKYNERFSEYQGDFLEYKEVMQKINDMENKILGNKIKIEMMKKKTIEQKKINEDKLKLVKKLNEKENI